MVLRAHSKRIVITGILVIWIVKFFIRPYLQLDETTRFIAGIAPNLIGSFVVPFAAYWLLTHADFFNGSLLRFPFFSDMRILCLLSFFLVTINEYLQLVPFFGRTFDYFDIAFSAVGFVLSYYSFNSLQRRSAIL